ncbi:sensor histidine kinase [Granulicella paludicola]|uniref:sensor histidine kinase n=1 Tax=Granulicella paludicola TaxID=474951 RepID=UPI0021E01EB7|nr:HAMP domain-containing sensor histidine kinase [Granulicella paludicola]
MKMKIVQLEAQSERSLSAKNALGRYADITLVHIATFEDMLREIESGDVDLLLCSASDLSQDTLCILGDTHPEVQIILLASEGERASLVRDHGLAVWDVITPEEMNRLPISSMRAVQTARERKGLQDELAQARGLLLSCQKSIAVGRLLGSIAHEINNPLEAISNLLYIGQRNLSDEEETRKCFRMAEEELHHVGEITKQMLHYHRDSKTVREVLPSEVMENILVLYKTRLLMRHIEVIRQYRSSQTLLAYPGEVRQAFSNLIANAIDAMPSGGQLIVRIRDAKRCKITVTVADRGNGISREAIGRLGELLFTTKGEAGTGLGLWVTYQLVAKYGGSVKVYSSIRSRSNGTVFRVCFSDPDMVNPGVEGEGSVPMGRHAGLLSEDKAVRAPSGQTRRRA